MLGDTVPRRISASTAIESGTETAPTKRSVTAKLAIRISDFFLALLLSWSLRSLTC